MASTSRLTQDGLRYVKKDGGSVITTPRAEHTRSCYRCGKFKLPSEMMTKKFAGTNHKVCSPKCD